MAEPKDWISVREAARLLGRSEESVRRSIRAYELPASRSGHGTRAAWLVNRRALERQQEIERQVAASRDRLDEAGVVVGHGEEFFKRVERRHGAPVAAQLRAIHDRQATFEHLEREMHDDPSVRQALEQLDEEEQIEYAARELARRVRRQERTRERTLEILEEDDK